MTPKYRAKNELEKEQVKGRPVSFVQRKGVQLKEEVPFRR